MCLEFMSIKSVAGIILAGGAGRRMKSRTPKLLHKLGSKPLIYYPIKLLRDVGVSRIIVVYRAERVRQSAEEFDGNIDFAFQKIPLGTGDAVRCGLSKVGEEATVIVLNGDDSIFYRPETIRKVIEIHRKNDADITFVTLKVADPTGFGRVVRKNSKVAGIIEEKAATERQKQMGIFNTKEINDGCYVFRKSWLEHNISKIPKSEVGEYYLTRLVDIGASLGAKIATYTLKNSDEWFGIDTKEKLKEANLRLINLKT